MTGRGGWAAALGVTAAIVLPSLAGAAAFTNGSFETGPAPGGFITLSAGDTSITGWTVRADSIDYIGTYWTAADGTRSLDLSGDAAGGIQQTFDTVPGWTYTVTFYLAGNPACGSAVKGLDVGASGGPTVHYTFDTTGHTTSAMGWQQETYAFVATGTATTLSFQSTEPSPCGPALDNVAVSATPPVPALGGGGVALLALVVAALGCLAFRRTSAA